MDESTAAIGFHSLSSHARFLYNLVPGQIHFARYEQSPLAQRPKKRLLLLLLSSSSWLWLLLFLLLVPVMLAYFAVVSFFASHLARTNLRGSVDWTTSWVFMAGFGHALRPCCCSSFHKHALLYTTSHSSSRHCFLRLLACYTRSLQSVPVGRATCFPSSHLSHARCSMPRFRSSNSE